MLHIVKINKIKDNYKLVKFIINRPKNKLKVMILKYARHVEETLKENQIIVNEENKQYIIDSPWKTVIESFVSLPENRNRELTTESVLTEAIEKPVERQNRYDQMQCANILKELGYEKKRRGGRSQRKWVYIKESECVHTSVYTE